MHHNSRLLSVCLGIALVCGCSRSPVVPVHGTVTFANRDVPEVCRLSFIPTDTAEGATIRPNGATMEADGNYRLTPYKGVEGLLPGTYTIRMSYFDLKRNGDPNREGDWIEKQYDAGELVVEKGSRRVEHNIEVR